MAIETTQFLRSFERSRVERKASRSGPTYEAYSSSVLQDMTPLLKNDKAGRLVRVGLIGYGYAGRIFMHLWCDPCQDWSFPLHPSRETKCLGNWDA
jgi:hypothetical protein